MTCKVRYLNSTGIMPREIKGIDALAKAFPASWLFYVSLNCYPRNQDPMEIDAVVVTDDQVLLLEIKDWNGQLTAKNDLWFIGRGSRGRSAVFAVEDKAKKLKTVLRTENAWAGAFFVESRVVLTGTATKAVVTIRPAFATMSASECRFTAAGKGQGETLRRRGEGDEGIARRLVETTYEAMLAGIRQVKP